MKIQRQARDRLRRVMVDKDKTPTSNTLLPNNLYKLNDLTHRNRNPKALMEHL